MRSEYSWPVQLRVQWPILDQELTVWGCERIARPEWPAHVASAGLWGTTDPKFTVVPGNPPLLVAVADVYAGPVCLRSLRDASTSLRRCRCSRPHQHSTWTWVWWRQYGQWGAWVGAPHTPHSRIVAVQAVSGQCLADAVRTGTTWTIRGGLTGKQRALLVAT